MNKLATFIVVSVVSLTYGNVMVMAGEVGGSNAAVTKSEHSTVLASGVTYSTLGNHNVVTTTDPDHPLNQSAGDCDGACVIDAEGEATCMGSCSWVDPDGDLAFFTWDGQIEGKWWFHGGSGKYAGASGTGTWKGRGPYPGNMAVNDWSGTIDLK